MTSYENNIMNLLPGSTPRQKYESLLQLMKVGVQLDKLEELTRAELRRQYPFDSQIDENKFVKDWNLILQSD